MGDSPSGSAANTHSVPFYFGWVCFVNRGVCLSAARSAASYKTSTRHDLKIITFFYLLS